MPTPLPLVNALAAKVNAAPLPTIGELQAAHDAQWNPKPVPKPESGWGVRTGKRFVANAMGEFANVANTLTLGQSQTVDEASDYWKEMARDNPHDTGNVRDSFSAGPGEFGKFLVENLGDSIGTMFPMLITLPLGAGLGAARGAATGGRMMLGTGIEAATAARLSAQAGAKSGAALTAFGMGTHQQAYETADTLQSEGIDPTALNVLPAAAAKGALDAIGLGKMASGLGLGKFFGAGVADEFAKRGITGIIKEIGTGMATEGITEAAQEAIDVGLVATLKNESLWKAYPREMQRIIDAGLTGAALGGALTTVGQAIPQAKPISNDRAMQIEQIAENLMQMRMQNKLQGQTGQMQLNFTQNYGTGDIPIVDNVPEAGSIDDFPVLTDPVAETDPNQMGMPFESNPFLPTKVIGRNDPVVYGTYQKPPQSIEQLNAAAGQEVIDAYNAQGMDPSKRISAGIKGGAVTGKEKVNGKWQSIWEGTVSSSGAAAVFNMTKFSRMTPENAEAFVQMVSSTASTIPHRIMVVTLPKNTAWRWKEHALANGAQVVGNSFVFIPKGDVVIAGLPLINGKVRIPGTEIYLDALDTPQISKMSSSISAIIKGAEAYAAKYLGLAQQGKANALLPDSGRLPSTSPEPINGAISSKVSSVASIETGHSVGEIDNLLAQATANPGQVFVAGLDKNMHNPAPWMDSIVAKMQPLAQMWTNKYTPNTSMVILPYFDPHRSGTGGSCRSFEFNGQTVTVIEVNLGRNYDLSSSNENTVSYISAKVLAHEFGHHIHNMLWHKAPQEIRNAVLVQFNAIRAKMGTMTHGQYTEMYTPHSHLRTTHKNNETPETLIKNIDYTYRLNDHEMFAEHLSDILFSESLRKQFDGRPELQAYLAQWLDTIKNFLKGLGKNMETKSAVTFFYKWMESPESLQIRREPRTPASAGIPGKVLQPLTPAQKAAKKAKKAAAPDQTVFGPDIITHMDGLSVESKNGISRTMDIDMRGFSLAKNLLSFPHLVDLYKVPALEVYWSLVKKIKVLKNTIIGEADLRMREWASLTAFSPKKKEDITSAIYLINDYSEIGGQRLTDEEIVKILSGNDKDRPIGTPLDEKSIQFVLDIQKDFSGVLSRMIHARRIEAAFVHIPDGEIDGFIAAWQGATSKEQRNLVMQQFMKVDAYTEVNGEVVAHPLVERMQEIDAQFASLMNKNYAPKMRHGKFILRVRATEDMVIEGKPFKKGSTVNFMGFDSKEKRAAVAADIMRHKDAGKLSITLDILTDIEHSVAGLPRAFLESILEQTNPDGAPTFSPAQRQLIRDMALEMSPSQSFLKQFVRRENIDGYSGDFQRTYAAYMFRAAGNISKTQYGRQTAYSIREFKRQKNTNLNPGVANNDAWSELEAFTQDHFKYIMSPDMDFSRVRSAVSAWFLAFMPRSAIANLYQVPMATIPYLSAKHGDSAAWKAVLKAYSFTDKFLTKRPENMTKEEAVMQAALKRAVEEGHIDASAIVELGAMSDTNIVDKMLGGVTGRDVNTQRVYNKAILDYGFKFFRGAEKINRRTTFLASYMLEYKKSGDAELAYNEAVKASEMTQFDMSKEARAAIFRGGKGVLLQFNQHLVGMSYLTFGGLFKSKREYAMGLRVLAISAVLAGTEGMPWAGLSLDLFDVIASLYKKMSGEEFTYTDARLEIKEMYKSMDLDPELWMHGVSSRFGLGPLSMASIFGAPEIDMSGAIGLGYPGNWAQMLRNTEGTSDQRWAKMVESIGGPAYSILNGMYKAAMGDNPNEWKQVESSMPAFMRSVSQGSRWIAQGGERTWDNAIIHPVTDDNMIDAFYKMAGFTPTGLAKKFSEKGTMLEMAAYYTARKSTLMAEYAYAKQSNSPEGLRIVRDHIARYNAVVRQKKVGSAFLIAPKNLQASYRQRERDRKRVEAGLAARKQQQELMNIAQLQASQQTMQSQQMLGR